MAPAPLTISVDLAAHRYPIHVGAGMLSDRARLEAALPPGPLLLVSNVTVAPLYAPRLRAALGARSIADCLLPDGEATKTLDTLAMVYDRLADAHIHRDGAILALGGGVVGDIAGFAAATWQRGIAYVQLPTTLLAQVDSSIGGKTGVNHPAGKNLIGAFHQPRAVLADLDTLATLADREFRAGLAEVVKCALICDRAFFEQLERDLPRILARDPAALGAAIGRACRIKAGIVAADEREQGARALLNLGHTFAHAIEAAEGYGKWLHGEAVAAGMMLAAETSARLGWLDAETLARVRTLLASAGLPVRAPRIGAARALELMALDKKVQRGRIRLVLLKSLGEAVVTGDYDARALDAVLAAELA